MDSIIDILSQGRDREGQASKVHGFVVGLVTNNKDPDKLGRVKVKFPWLSDEVESWWARMVYPMGGKDRGFLFLPEIDDEVLVGFEHGDVRFPYILGGLHNGKDTPPGASSCTGGFSGHDDGSYSVTDFNEDGKNDVRVFKSRSGHLLIFDDKDGKEKITLTDHTGAHRIEVFTDKKKVIITSSDGNIELHAAENIIMKAGKNIETDSGADTVMNVGAKWTVDSGDDMTHTSGKNYKREASMTVEEKAGTSAKYESGTSMDIKAGTMGTFKTGAPLTVQSGATAEIKASAIMTIKGAMVKIN